MKHTELYLEELRKIDVESSVSPRRNETIISPKSAGQSSKQIKRVVESMHYPTNSNERSAKQIDTMEFRGNDHWFKEKVYLLEQ